MIGWNKIRWVSSFVFASAWLLQAGSFIFLWSDHLFGFAYVLGLLAAWVLPLIGMDLAMCMHGCSICGRITTGPIYCRTCWYRAKAVARVFQWPCACGHTHGSHNNSVGCCSDWCPCEKFASPERSNEPLFVRNHLDLLEASMRIRQKITQAECSACG